MICTITKQDLVYTLKLAARFDAFIEIATGNDEAVISMFSITGNCTHRMPAKIMESGEVFTSWRRLSDVAGGIDGGVTLKSDKDGSFSIMGGGVSSRIVSLAADPVTRIKDPGQSVAIKRGDLLSALEKALRFLSKEKPEVYFVHWAKGKMESTDRRRLCVIDLPFPGDVLIPAADAEFIQRIISASEKEDNVEVRWDSALFGVHCGSTGFICSQHAGPPFDVSGGIPKDDPKQDTGLILPRKEFLDALNAVNCLGQNLDHKCRVFSEADGYTISAKTTEQTIQAHIRASRVNVGFLANINFLASLALCCSEESILLTVNGYSVRTKEGPITAVVALMREPPPEPYQEPREQSSASGGPQAASSDTAPPKSTTRKKFQPI